MKFEEKLITLRKAKCWSQEELAEKIGTTRQAVSRWETGSTLPDVENLKKLCDIFGVTADYMINDYVENTVDEHTGYEMYKNNVNRYFYLIACIVCLGGAVFSLIYGILRSNVYSFIAMGVNVALCVLMIYLFIKQKRT